MPFERPFQTGRAPRRGVLNNQPLREPAPPRYSDRRRFFQISLSLRPALAAFAVATRTRATRTLVALALATLALATLAGAAPCAAQGAEGAARPAAIRLVAFGDSLIAGYGLPQQATFPALLERALRAEGLDVVVTNGGVSGDTASGGLARLGWTLADGADGVILELGANDMLRGLDPNITRTALDSLLAELKARNVKTLIAGMKANPSLGASYKTRFDAIFPELAAKYDAPLYPFFLDGVATEPSLKQPDGLHPNAAGVERIVKGILPSVTAFVKQFRQ